MHSIKHIHQILQYPLERVFRLFASSLPSQQVRASTKNW